jgi:hypothetical protein
MTMRRRQQWTTLILGLALVIAAGCGSGESSADANPVAAQASQPEGGEGGPDASGGEADQDVPGPDVADGGAEEGDGDDPSAPPADDGDDPCRGCVSPEDMTAIVALVDAYNTGEWDAFSAAMGTTEPSWETGFGTAQDIHIRADLEWAAALNQTWTLGDCVGAEGFVVCDLTVEDDFHRALGEDWGVPPSECGLTVNVAEAPPVITRYRIDSCFLGYDLMFHAYGSWFESAYPEQEGIEGFHYRAWNQFGEGAPERAAAHLDEWVATLAIGVPADEHDHGEGHAEEDEHDDG